MSGLREHCKHVLQHDVVTRITQAGLEIMRQELKRVPQASPEGKRKAWVMRKLKAGFFGRSADKKPSQVLGG